MGHLGKVVSCSALPRPYGGRPGTRSDGKSSHFGCCRCTILGQTPASIMQRNVCIDQLTRSRGVRLVARGLGERVRAALDLLTHAKRRAPGCTPECEGVSRAGPSVPMQRNAAVPCPGLHCAGGGRNVERSTGPTPPAESAQPGSNLRGSTAHFVWRVDVEDALRDLEMRSIPHSTVDDPGMRGLRGGVGRQLGPPRRRSSTS